MVSCEREEMQRQEMERLRVRCLWREEKKKESEEYGKKCGGKKKRKRVTSTGKIRVFIFFVFSTENVENEKYCFHFLVSLGKYFQ